MGFRYSLSGALWVLTLCAIFLAFFSALENCADDDFIGDWFFHDAGLNETMLINRDGTFTKCYEFKFGKISFSGGWSISAKGIITFHSQKRIEDTEVNVDIQTRCRFAIDSNGNLMFYELDQSNFENRSSYPYLYWHCYSPEAPDFKDIEKHFNEIFEKQRGE